MKTNNLFYYKCPDDLGHLEIKLDKKLKVISSIFVNKKNKDESESCNENKNKDKASKEKEGVQSEIKNSLDNYFYKKKDLPSNLMSKEIIGTDFQKDIWKVILGTKFGETITYTDMAIKAGKPESARAAGTACGKNLLALFIPCHRVVRKQNEDYGYSWGIERKKWLLNFENKNLFSL